MLKVVTNMTTAANLLLSGGANIGEVVGADTQRLTSLYSQSVDAPFGVLWFNQKQGTPTAQEPVRKALTQSLQLTQLGQVLTSGTGTPSTGMVAPALSPCKGNTVGANLPAYDQSAAKSALAGQKLTIAVYYPTSLGTGATGAATLLQQTWSQLGVTVSLHGITDPEIDTAIVAGQAAWNIAILPLGARLAPTARAVPFRRDPAHGHQLRLPQQRRLHGGRDQGLGDRGQRGLPRLERGGDRAVQERRPGAVRRLGPHRLRQGRDLPAHPGMINPASIRMLG